MNTFDIYTYLIPVVAFLIGAVGGIVALMVVHAGRDQPHDSHLLDFLEQSECNLFFNPQVDGGMWGFLGGDNGLITSGTTVRATLQRAREKEAAAALATIAGEIAQGPHTRGSRGL